MTEPTPAAERPDGHASPPTSLPPYYTSYGPFSSWLRTVGSVVLTYHKLGPRPRGTRLKGLYVSTALFRRQLRELAAAGFQSAGLDIFTSFASSKSPRVVITFDDGFVNAGRLAVEPLRETGFQAIQFLVPGLIGRTNEWEQRQGEVTERLMDAAQIRDWLAAGHEIGAHTLTHPWLTRIPLAEAREEIRGSKAWLEDRFGRRIEHFCYPYGDGNPAVRDLVREAGFATACTTDSGVNQAAGDVFRLRRMTARYTSRNWRNLLAALRRLWR